MVPQSVGCCLISPCSPVFGRQWDGIVDLDMRRSLNQQTTSIYSNLKVIESPLNISGSISQLGHTIPQKFPVNRIKNKDHELHSLDLPTDPGCQSPVSRSIIYIYIPSRKLTYPTWGKGKSSSKCHFWGDMLVSWSITHITFLGSGILH